MKALVAYVLAGLAISANASSICSMSYCYAGAQFNSANKISSTQAIGGVAPCFQNVAGGVACYAYNGLGACPFPGMVDCGSSGSSGSSTTGPTVAPVTTSLTPIGTVSKSPAVVTTTPSSTPSKSPTYKPSPTPVSSNSGSKSNGSKSSGSSSGTPSTTADNRAANSNESSGTGVWPYLVGGGAAMLLIGVIVILLVKKSRDGEDDDEIEDHIYQSQHRSGKHSMQSVSNTHLSPYDMKQTHTYDVEMGYQPTIGYQDPRAAAPAKPQQQYVPQAIPKQQIPPANQYSAPTNQYPAATNQYSVPANQYQAPSRGDMHLLPDTREDDDRHSVTF
ncbi:hypothetical protein THRCLA_04001 [Thraustotheca clavata]|uniref:Carbohydrate-binding protein n=1 Tax=Thraustotheca clavata TaxID=74557 RepID=A0A1W0A069_9STRA|nr:hypothetical protein THRCLA_04001 [Thraustotheca clavata]